MTPEIEPVMWLVTSAFGFTALAVSVEDRWTLPPLGRKEVAGDAA